MTLLILCGGSGTRLWPISRSNLPKQFFPLFESGSLFESTLARNLHIIDKHCIAVSAKHTDLAIGDMGKKNVNASIILEEPCGRNTAPAIALISMALDPEEILLVSPSDHLIVNESAYKTAIARASELALQGKIVTFGIKPNYPETGFGYIQHEGEKVIRFVEKPNQEVAKSYLESGDYLWNAGLFCFKAGVFLTELKKYAPDIFQACQTVFEKQKDKKRIAPNREEMESIPSVSVDYAVMEKTDRVAVVPCDMGWSDLGSFDSLYDLAVEEGSQNSSFTQEDALFLNSSQNLVIARGDKKVVLVDMNDCLVVDTPDALLVMRRGSSQKVKDVVEKLRAENYKQL
jgi:mannose-1-phosphate guanylyltransferase